MTIHFFVKLVIETKIMSIKNIENQSFLGEELTEEILDEWVRECSGHSFKLTEEILDQILKELQLDLSEQDVKKILSSLKAKLDNKQNSLNSIAESVECYVSKQDIKRSELLKQSSLRVQNSITESVELVNELSRDLSGYKESNGVLLNIIDAFTSFIFVRNSMLVLFGITLIISVVAFPLILKNKEDTHRLQLEKVCELAESKSKICH